MEALRYLLANTLGLKDKSEFLAAHQARKSCAKGLL
jgi:hypothetical protein